MFREIGGAAGRGGVVRRCPAGPEEEIQQGLRDDPTFSHGHAALAAVCITAAVSVMLLNDLTGAAPVALSDLGRQDVFARAWSPDGRTLYIVRVDLKSNVATLSAHDMQSGQEREIVRREGWPQWSRQWLEVQGAPAWQERS